MQWLRSRIIGASQRTEFAFVTLLAFAWPCLGSTLWVARMTASNWAAVAARRAPISDAGLLASLAYESVVIVALIWALHLRGWSRARFGFDPGWRSTAIGLGLAACVYISSWVIIALVALASPHLFGMMQGARLVAPGIGLGTIIAAATLNPVFEELFLCGYLITVLKQRRGFWFAVNASSAIRLFYHLYQGPVAVAFVLPVGLVFGYWYARTSRLWPLIVAHALIDFIGLLARS